MCCDPYGSLKEMEEAASTGIYCAACGSPVNGDGESAYGCRYSPVVCEVCGDSPCDGSC